MRLLFAALVLALPLGACANKGVNDIDIEDSSQAYKVKFGTVLDAKTVNVRSEDSGALAGGAMLGGIAGAMLSHTNGGTLAGLLLGGFSGYRIHAMAETGNAVQYTVALADGDTIVIAQLQESGDRVFKSNDAVMVQYGSTVNRVLATDHLPDVVAKPKIIRVEGATEDKINSKACDKATIGRSTREVCTQH